MFTAEQLEQAIKALEITENTVLFVDIEQVNPKLLERMRFEFKTPIVGVVGKPNVEALTVKELESVLERARSVSR